MVDFLLILLMAAAIFMVFPAIFRLAFAALVIVVLFLAGVAAVMAYLVFMAWTGVCLFWSVIGAALRRAFN